MPPNCSVPPAGLTVVLTRTFVIPESSPSRMRVVPGGIETVKPVPLIVEPIVPVASWERLIAPPDEGNDSSLPLTVVLPA